MTQTVGGVENLFKDGFGAALKVDDFASTIVGGLPPLDPTILLKAIEQACERWLFNAHTLSDFLLRQLVSTL